MRSPAFAPAASKKKEDVEVLLPCFLPEVRFSVSLAAGGATWTTGAVYVTPAGFCFLSDKDGLASEAKAAEVAAEVADQPKRFAPQSIFAPKANAKRLVHGQFAGNFLQMVDFKVPLRLTNDGWARLIAACRKLGVTVEV